MNHGGILTAYDDELPALYSNGIRAVVSLLNIPSGVSLRVCGFASQCLPVADGGAPTMEQAQQFVSFVDQHRGEHRPVAVHCEAGFGRTGTMLAAYLISKGENVKSAIARVRAAEKTAIETPNQIDFLERFARTHGGNLTGASKE